MHARSQSLPEYCLHGVVHQLEPVTLGMIRELAFDDEVDVPEVKTVVRVLDPILEERVRYLREHSQSFRESWDTLRESEGFRVLIGDADQLLEAIPSFRNHTFESDAASIHFWINDKTGKVHRTLVVRVDVHGIYRVNYALGNTRDDFLIDLDTVLAHEVHGHLLSFLLRGEYLGACGSEEVAGFVLANGVLERANQVRSEVGVLPITGEGLRPDESRRPAWDTSPYDPHTGVEAENPNRATYTPPKGNEDRNP